MTSPSPIPHSTQNQLPSWRKAGDWRRLLRGYVNTEMLHPDSPSRNDWPRHYRQSCQLLKVSGSAAESALSNVMPLLGQPIPSGSSVAVGVQRWPLQPNMGHTSGQLSSRAPTRVACIPVSLPVTQSCFFLSQCWSWKNILHSSFVSVASSGKPKFDRPQDIKT